MWLVTVNITKSVCLLDQIFTLGCHASNSKYGNLQSDNQVATCTVYGITTANIASYNQLYRLSALPHHHLILIKC
jgi:hypothetical protein